MSLVKFLNTSATALVAAVLLVAAPAPVHALNLDQAKSQGMVCELPTGYLKVTGAASADAGKLVEEINKKRKAEYERIAKENNVKPEQVGILTAKKLGPKCQ